MTRQGRRDQALLNIDKRNDPWGTPYFWFGFERPPSKIVKGTDLGAIDEGRISITPLCLNLTDDPTREALQAAFPSNNAGATGKAQSGASSRHRSAAMLSRRRPHRSTIPA